MIAIAIVITTFFAGIALGLLMAAFGKDEF